MTNLDTDVPQAAEVAESPIPAEPASEGVEATEAQPEAKAAVEPEPIDYLDTSEIGDRMVKLTIDGEEQSVPLNDVLQGYNSNAAATKRFQEAAAIKAEAAQALNLAQAVQNNPGMTMQVLASQAGLTVEQFLNLSPQQQQDVATAEPVPEFSDPLEKSLYEERQARVALEQRFDQMMKQQEASAADAELQQAIDGLQTIGATPEDAQAVVAQALDMSQRTGQYVGPEMFPMIYQAQQFQKSQANSQAQAQVQTEAQAETARRQAAAAQASAAVGTGSGATGTAPASVVQPTTILGGIEGALDSLGVS